MLYLPKRCSRRDEGEDQGPRAEGRRAPERCITVRCFLHGLNYTVGTRRAASADKYIVGAAIDRPLLTTKNRRKASLMPLQRF